MNKKLMVLFSILMCFTFTIILAGVDVQAAQTLTENAKGKIDGYDYELWKDNGTTSMTLNGGGTFSCSWSNINNALFRTGKKYDETKTWQELGSIKLNYECDYQPSGNSYLAVYGWTSSPLVEYYIVESWGSWRPPGSTSKGTITVDGAVYDLYETTRTNQPSIKGTATFEQYWSVRQQKRTSGTITVSDHFKAWEAKGMKMGKMYEVSMVVEGYQSSGRANMTKMSINSDDPINPGKTIQLGDVDGSGTVDALDLAAYKQYLLSRNTTFTVPEAADTDQNGSMDALDFSRIKQHLLGLIKLGTITIGGGGGDIDPTKKLIALTFDDGPDATMTPKVLDRLEKYGAKGTFMMIGQNINSATASVIKRINNDGYEIGNHSWDYQSMNNMSATDIKTKIANTTAAIQQYSGQTPKFFRAPNLAYSQTLYSSVDLTFIQGVICQDWNGGSATTAQARADLAIAGAKDGAIILLHDNQPAPHPTAEALDIIIPTLQQQGYQFVTLSELFKAKGVDLSTTGDKVYSSVP